MPQANYEERKQARIDRYHKRAERADEQGQQAYRAFRSIADRIPFGQPILVGHHSERGHRRDITRMDSNIRKSCELQAKATHYQARAEAAESNRAISSDDPEAVRKLKAKIAKEEKLHEGLKTINRIVRRKPKNQPTDEKVIEIRELAQCSEATAREFFVPDFCGRIGVPSYNQSNRNANIKRMKNRLVDLQAMAAAEEKTTDHGTFEIVENVDENRIQIIFPDKPSEDVRATLKAHGFRWSRYNGAWQRHLNNAGRAAAEYIANTIQKES